jgi:hypothetical protein
MASYMHSSGFEAGALAELPDSGEVPAQLTAIREQLAAIHEQLIAIHTLLARLLQDPTAEAHLRAAVSHSAGAQGIGTLASCMRDIVRVLQEVGHPLTILEILDEMVHRQLRWRENTVRHALADMQDKSVVRDTSAIRPHSYDLTIRK